jgi:hypothetical protein
MDKQLPIKIREKAAGKWHMYNSSQDREALACDELTRNKIREESEGGARGGAVPMMNAECTPGRRDDVAISNLKSRPLHLHDVRASAGVSRSVCAYAHQSEMPGGGQPGCCRGHVQVKREFASGVGW